MARWTQRGGDIKAAAARVSSGHPWELRGMHGFDLLYIETTMILCTNRVKSPYEERGCKFPVKTK
jgi:hypothetical protein